MSSKKEILIIGAGPSGLSMAIFLSELGYHPRIIDKKSGIGIHSKALGVNPRSLELFEPLGITDRFLKNGTQLTAINIWKADQHIFRNDLSKVNHKYPFMLIQPQKESEEILLDEVRKRNIEVEYNTEMQSIQKSSNRYLTQLSASTAQYNHTSDYIIGADGGNSKVRASIESKLKGYRYDENWELYDIEIALDINPKEGHIRLFPEGAMIMLPMKNNIWRVAGNLTSILNYLPKNSNLGSVHWESNFRIHHKLAQTLVHDHIGLIGDAAHLHSPVGARGMNLGIEDAYLMAQLIHNDQLSTYEKSRLPYLNKTVNRINNITMTLAGNTARSRFIRKNIGMFRILFPIAMAQARKFAMGLN